MTQTPDLADLVERAWQARHPLRLPFGCTAGDVGAALVDDAGELHTGVCVDLACGLGFCAEASAMARMLGCGRTRVLAMVAVGGERRILPPCGRCREMLAQLNPANFVTTIILPGGQHASLAELLPRHWLFDSPQPKDATP